MQLYEGILGPGTGQPWEQASSSHGHLRNWTENTLSFEASEPHKECEARARVSHMPVWLLSWAVLGLPQGAFSSAAFRESLRGHCIPYFPPNTSQNKQGGVLVALSLSTSAHGCAQWPQLTSGQCCGCNSVEDGISSGQSQGLKHPTCPALRVQVARDCADPHGCCISSRQDDSGPYNFCQTRQE